MVNETTINEIYSKLYAKLDELRQSSLITTVNGYVLSSKEEAIFYRNFAISKKGSICLYPSTFPEDYMYSDLSLEEKILYNKIFLPKPTLGLQEFQNRCEMLNEEEGII